MGSEARLGFLLVMVYSYGMGGLTRWRLPGTGRAEVVAAVLVATTILAVLATRWYQAWLPPLVSAAGGLPALYLAWRALAVNRESAPRRAQCPAWERFHSPAYIVLTNTVSCDRGRYASGRI